MQDSFSLRAPQAGGLEETASVHACHGDSPDNQDSRRPPRFWPGPAPIEPRDFVPG